MENSEKVITPEQTDINGVVGQSGEQGGDSQQTSVADETANEKVVPLNVLKTVESKLKAEREQREISEREINNLKAKLAQIENNLNQPKQDPYEGRDAYDPVTLAELKAEKAQIKAELSHALHMNRVAESAARARMKYSEGDFTYDDALRIFQSNALTDEERLAILNSNDPGERMVKYVKSLQEEPANSKKTQEKANEIAQKMTANVNQAQTLSSASKTASKSLNKLKELQKMTPQEHRKYVDDLLRQKQGG